MKKLFVVLFAIISVVGFGCAKKADVAAEREAIMKADADWNTAMQSKNADEFVNYFAADGVLMMPNMPALSGAEAIRSTMSQMMSSISVSWTPTNADVAASGDLGYTTGTYQASMTMPDGSTHPDNGKYATVWKKQADGSWKVVVDIFNSDVPMPMPQTTAPGDTTAAPGQ
jgi:uncharacterized protein (TIGR02246 family)